jgi:hypothetical protein
MKRLLSLLTLLVLTAGFSAHAAALLPIGVARTDITPEGPIRLCGYASRTTESEGVDQRLRDRHRRRP